MSGITWNDGARVLMECRNCGQAGRVDKNGTGVTVRCFAGCDQDAALNGVDVEQLFAEVTSTNGNSPLVSKQGLGRGLGRGRGLGVSKSTEPLTAPSSSSSFQGDGVPMLTAWLLYRDANPGPVEVPEKVQAVLDFLTKLHRLRVKPTNTARCRSRASGSAPTSA